MRLQETQIRIQTLLTQWVGEIEAETNFGQNDKKVISEIVLMSLLREIYGYAQLKTLNADAGFNYPGIDLADEQARIAIQVTATKTSKKISDTLTGFLNHEQYKLYDRLIVYILTEKQQSYSSSDLLAKVDELTLKQQELGLEQAIFDLERDVWDSSNLMHTIAAIDDVERAERILKILEQHFGQHETPSVRRWKSLAKPEARFGGQDKLEALVQALLEPVPQPVLVQGLAGIGKSNLCEHGLDHPDVRSRFGSRRAFVRCDAATNRENLVAQIAAEIAVHPGPNLEPRVLSELEREPCVIVLDNLETPWIADPLPVENLLSVLVGLPGMVLVGGVRGGSRPVGPSWVSIQPELLSIDEAKALFLEFSERKFASDPNLDVLLGRLDGLPLAIKILAPLSQGDPDLSGLLRRYDAKRSVLLNQSPNKARSLPVSLELSFESPRMNDVSRVGASVLALLPDGVLHSDLNNVLEDGDEVAHTLRSVGLVFDREGRLRMLAPVREHLDSAHPAGGEALERVVGFYAGLVLQHGDTVGREGGLEAVERLGPEFGNASYIALRVAEFDIDFAVQVAFNLGEFASFTGFEVVHILEKVLLVIEIDLQKAEILRKLGEITLRTMKVEYAQKKFEEAEAIHGRCENYIGQAWCIQRLGEISLLKSEKDKAENYYERALNLFEACDLKQGQAECLRNLGELALHRHDFKTALEKSQKALDIFQIINDLLGQANCLRILASVKINYEDDIFAGKIHIKNALHLYKTVGSYRGVAQCSEDRGDLALKEGNILESLDHFEDAISRYADVGDTFGCATSMFKRGKILAAQEDVDDAREVILSAQSIFQNLSAIQLIADTHHELSEIARDDTERNHHIAEARRLWLSIGRQDLVEKYLPSLP